MLEPLKKPLISSNQLSAILRLLDTTIEGFVGARDLTRIDHRARPIQTNGGSATIPAWMGACDSFFLITTGRAR
jgi:hypothetical protein